MTDEKNWRDKLRPVGWTSEDESDYIKKKLYELERQISDNEKALLKHLENKCNALGDSINEVDARYKKECKTVKLYWIVMMFSLLAGSWIKFFIS